MGAFRSAFFVAVLVASCGGRATSGGSTGSTSGASAPSGSRAVAGSLVGGAGVTSGGSAGTGSGGVSGTLADAVVICPLGTSSAGALCVPCATGMTACLVDGDGTCVDAQTDPNNCGGCGITCPVPAPSCQFGTCCDPAGVVCDDTVDSGPVPSDAGQDVQPQTLICPTTVPPNGMAPCLLEIDGGSAGFLSSCEYGGNAYGACTTIAVCGTGVISLGSWTVTPAPNRCGTNAAACPATYGLGEGSACPLPGTCDYPQGRCGCLSCLSDAGTAGGYWHCRAWDDPSVGASCPAERPLIGTACTVPEGTVCFYDACCGGPSLGPSVQCTGGAWGEYASGECSCTVAFCP